MDILSYKLGKNASGGGGGGDTPEYFVMTPTNSQNTMSKMIKAIPKINLINITGFGYAFSNYASLEEIPELNTSNVTNVQNTFYNCSSLETIPLLDFGKVENLTSTFNGCSKLTNLGGFKNLGKAYLTSKSANIYEYMLDLSVSTLITHDSLMNVINNLYDIATKGCNTQTLKLGATNKAKLSAEEIAIATTKGWNVQ